MPRLSHKSQIPANLNSASRLHFGKPDKFDRAPRTIPGVLRDAVAGAAPGSWRRLMRKITFSFSPTGAGRKHYLTEEDVTVLLSRLPEELWERLRAVHFNDRALGRRMAGYVNMGRREIAICALPQRVSLSSFITHRSPLPFGALRGRQWPEVAVRRFMLYDVFLHELGHLKIIDPAAKRLQRQFASETKAQEFAAEWREKLWSEPFNHPDPVHNQASAEELESLKPATTGA
jgi:hypothetical protein